jgi:hypothetical protein
MKALNTTTIDNHTLIIGTGPAEDFIDPVATENKIIPILQKTDTKKQIDEKLKQISIYSGQIMQAKKARKKSTSEADIKKHDDEIKLRSEQIRDIQKDLMPLAEEIKNIRRDLIKSEAVYFSTPAGTSIISDAEAEEIENKLRQANENGKRLKADKTEIDDLRGKVFYKKTGSEWFKFAMLKIGDVPPSGAILEADLLDNQRAEITAQEEKKRIADMKSSDREAEKNIKIDSLISQAVNKRIEFEIQGDKDPAKSAKAWYDAEVQKVEGIYGA